MTDAETSVLGVTLHQAVRHLARQVDALTAERDRARALAEWLMDELTPLETWPVEVVDDCGFTVRDASPMSTHSRDVCQGRGCPVHNASDHHMREWPQTWRADGRFTERLCPHGIGHPDPDDTHAAKRVHGHIVGFRTDQPGTDVTLEIVNHDTITGATP